MTINIPTINRDTISRLAEMLEKDEALKSLLTDVVNQSFDYFARNPGQLVVFFDHPIMAAMTGPELTIPIVRAFGIGFMLGALGHHESAQVDSLERLLGLEDIRDNS